MKIRALVVEAKDAPFKLQEIELAEPGRGEVLVRIAASGVCHTDAITRAGDAFRTAQALADSKSGKVAKSVLRMPH
jgi:Zn-dependent alcohol dehydrogenase